jgi:hypothetical protein
MSYVDANRGRVVSIGQDVLDIKRRIEDRWPELEVFYDVDAESYIVVEHCRDGVDRLAIERPYLDERLYEACAMADQSRTDEDRLQVVEAWNAGIEKERDDKFADIMGEAGQRLAHALHKDGIGGRLQVTIPNRP